MLSLQDSSNLAPSQLIVMLGNFIKEIVPVGNVITGAVCYVDYKAKSVSVYNCGHTNVFAYLKDDAGKGRVATLAPTLPPFGMGAVADAITGEKRVPIKCL